MAARPSRDWRGGRLYDKWFAENKAEKPTADHPAYPHQGGKYGKDASWRCKECHGWDYSGKEGAYEGWSRDRHQGIRAAAGKDPTAIVAMRKRQESRLYGGAAVRQGRRRSRVVRREGPDRHDEYSDAATGKPKGDGKKGEVYFNTLCAGCHGLDGKKVKDAPPLGSVADNAAEMMHKLLNGQPAEAMPALRALDPQISADIAVHLQSLPK